jgi:hypothetical protein
VLCFIAQDPIKMEKNVIPFQVTDWSKIPTTTHQGESGIATWQTLQLGGLRIRKVEYSENYVADHWCEKGHLFFVLEGALTTELRDGRKFEMTTGKSYEVSDGESSHRSVTSGGAKLLIVDGSFLAK